MPLTGAVSGTSRKDLEENARQIASTYYDTKCVEVHLADEIVEHEMTSGDGRAVATTFSASFQAAVAHRWNQPAYGFSKCLDCDLRASK